MTSVTKPPDEMRADGRRNRAALLAAASAVFARDGIEASLQAVAAEAGVGRGSLYRHFPTREALFAAIMADQVEELRQRGEAVLAGDVTRATITSWLEAYCAAAKRYPGMSAQMSHALADEGSRISQACAPMKNVFAEIHAKAQAAGLIRGPLTARQVLMLVANLPGGAPPDAAGAAYLDVVLRGLFASDSAAAG